MIRNPLLIILLISLGLSANRAEAQMTLHQPRALANDISLPQSQFEWLHPDAIQVELLRKNRGRFERKRNRKALACLGLLTGAALKIQSRSVYNDYLSETEESSRQTLYDEANNLHKASLISFGLGGLFFIIPVGNRDR